MTDCLLLDALRWMAEGRLENAATILGAGFSINILVASLSFSREGVGDAVRNELIAATNDKFTSEIARKIEKCGDDDSVKKAFESFKRCFEGVKNELPNMLKTAERVARISMVAFAVVTIVLLAFDCRRRFCVLFLMPYPAFYVYCKAKGALLVHSIKSRKRKLEDAIGKATCEAQDRPDYSSALEAMSEFNSTNRQGAAKSAPRRRKREKRGA